MSDTPIQPAFIEDTGEPTSLHQLSQEGLTFRAQVNGVTNHDQLIADVAELGAVVVSPNLVDQDSRFNRLLTFISRISRS